MNAFLKIGMLKEEICEMIIKREHDISNPLSLPQLRNDPEYQSWLGTKFKEVDGGPSEKEIRCC